VEARPGDAWQVAVESPEAAALQAVREYGYHGYSLRNPFPPHCRFDRRADVTQIGIAARLPILDRPEEQN
jgi:hypothetical protein